MLPNFKVSCSLPFMLIVSLIVQVSHSLQNELKAFKVVITITDLDRPNVVKMTLPGPMSSPLCGSVALQNYPLYRLFCKTPEGDCIVSNAVYARNYNDGSDGGDYKCYSIKLSLFPKGYVPPPGVCPYPFQSVAGTGCIYINPFAFAIFDVARQECQSILPGVDLFTGQPTSALTGYLNSIIAIDPWVGIRKDSTGTFKRIDGSSVGFEWDTLQPDGRSYIIFIPGRSPDCVVIFTLNLLAETKKFADNFCDEIHLFICELKM